MRHLYIGALAVAFGASGIACKDKSPPQVTAEATGSEAMTASAAPSASGQHARRSCPSRVHGATATASDVDGGVVISVTAQDDATVAEIHARAGSLSSVAAEPHHGRFCPEMVDGATRTVTLTKSGADITLAASAADLARVRADVRDRLTRSEKRAD